jgi:hypothetical protein
MQRQLITLKAGYSQLSTHKIHKNQKFKLILPKTGSNVIATLDVQLAVMSLPHWMYNWQ